MGEIAGRVDSSRSPLAAHVAFAPVGSLEDEEETAPPFPHCDEHLTCRGADHVSTPTDSKPAIDILAVIFGEGRPAIRRAVGKIAVEQFLKQGTGLADTRDHPLGGLVRDDPGDPLEREPACGNSSVEKLLQHPVEQGLRILRP